MSAFAITVDTATPLFRRLAGRLEGQGRGNELLMVWGARVRKTAIMTALSKGGRRLWREIARSINLQFDTAAVTVGSDHRVAAQKQYGGPIRAKGRAAGGADALTIPIAPEAEGQSASKFALAGRELFAIHPSGGESGVLGYDDDGEFHPLFALVTETRPQAPDPFMPDEQLSARMGEEEAVKLLERG